MSIIYDALKKVERSAPPAAQRRRRAVGLYILFLTIACLGFLIAAAVTTVVSKVAPRQTVLPALPPPPGSAVSAPEAPPKAKTPLIVNGVFFSKNHGYALVNNQVVREGDYIQGAKVVKILLDGVKFEIEMQTVVIPLTGSLKNAR